MRDYTIMHAWVSCVFVFLGLGLLAAAPPPSNPPATALEDSALPLPRAVPQAPTPGAIVEEPAPAPHEQPTFPTGGLPPGQFQEETAPMPREQTPSPPRLLMPGSVSGGGSAEVETLHREIENLRMEREAMLAEEVDLVTSRDVRSAARNDSAHLRQRVTELLTKIAQKERQERLAATTPPQKSKGKSSPSPTPRASKPSPVPGVASSPAAPSGHSPQPMPSAPSVTPPEPAAKVVTEAQVDPLSLAQSLFRACDYAGALNVYRKLEQEEQKPEERAGLQYMMACCLRKLGKRDEASMLYREVANSSAAEILLENAQWYLRTMKDRSQLEAELEELRQRRQTLMPRKL